MRKGNDKKKRDREKIIKILREHEGELSDGFDFYGTETDEDLYPLADEISEALKEDNDKQENK